MVINTNIAALDAANDLNQSSSALNASLARLSTGSQLVNASDDPAALAESISLNAEIGQTNAANGNVGNAISFSQTQDGYLQQVGSALDQMAALSVQAQDGTISSSQLADYNTEFSALSSYITDARTKTFNGVSLFASTTGTPGLTVGGTGYTMAAINVGTGSAMANLTSSSVGGWAYTANPLLSQIPNSGVPVANGNFTIAVGAGNAATVNFTASESMSNVFSAISTATGGAVSGSFSTSTGKVTLTSTGGNITLSNPGNSGSNFLYATSLVWFGQPTGDSATVSSVVSTDVPMIDSPAGPTYDLLSTNDASTALAAVTGAIAELGTDRATVGANLERLEYTSQQLSTLSTNLTAANSQISDVDVAKESTNFAKYQILVQSGTAMLSQANQNPQNVLKLIQNL
ncbi:MAG: flagellin [Verrucomicrobiota bacterium]|jgi:flagellin